MNTVDKNKNPWNPFLPTERDVDRTQELAAKNPVIAGVLTYFFLPLGLIYLNRGVNTLKLCGYLFVASLLIGIMAESEEDASRKGFSAGILGNIAITAEQVITVNKARQRFANTPK